MHSISVSYFFIVLYKEKRQWKWSLELINCTHLVTDVASGATQASPGWVEILTLGKFQHSGQKHRGEGRRVLPPRRHSETWAIRTELNHKQKRWENKRKNTEFFQLSVVLRSDFSETIHMLRKIDFRSYLEILHPGVIKDEFLKYANFVLFTRLIKCNVCILIQ